MRLEGKVAFVSGGARGMGAAEARLFVREGAKVAIGDVLEAEGRQLEAEINETGGEALFVRTDVTSEADWQRAISATVERFGGLHILVNNAGVVSWGTLEDTTVAEWDRVMDVNAKGVFLGTKAAIVEMRKGGGGSIINISSISGMIGQEGIQPVYNASKGAVRIFTKAAAVQYAREGIRVNSLHPGSVATPMTQDRQTDPEQRRLSMSRIPLGRIAEPEEIAYGALFLASDESSFMTGSELVIDGGFTAQ
jgi:NAD(P)-dependent dehydrogenase (short-subunit alcohol dehydrogenase family)